MRCERGNIVARAFLFCRRVAGMTATRSYCALVNHLEKVPVAYLLVGLASKKEERNYAVDNVVTRSILRRDVG